MVLYLLVQGIIRRVQEDGPDRGNVDLDILPRSVRYRLRDVMDDVRTGPAVMHLFGVLKLLQTESGLMMSPRAGPYQQERY